MLPLHNDQPKTVRFSEMLSDYIQECWRQSNIIIPMAGEGSRFKRANYKIENLS